MHFDITRDERGCSSANLPSRKVAPHDVAPMEQRLATRRICTFTPDHKKEQLMTISASDLTGAEAQDQLPDAVWESFFEGLADGTNATREEAPDPQTACARWSYFWDFPGEVISLDYWYDPANIKRPVFDYEMVRLFPEYSEDEWKALRKQAFERGNMITPADCRRRRRTS